MILPTFHVPTFQIEECNSLPADVSWSVSEGNMKTKCLFPVKNNFPSIKSMTFENRTEPMDVAVSYSEGGDNLEGIPTLLSRYRIEPPTPKHEKHSLKLRIKLDQNQIPSLDSAELIEHYKEEKKIPIKASTPPAPAAPKEESKDAAKDGDKKEEKKEEPKAPEQKFETKIVDKEDHVPINFKWEKHGLSNTQIAEFVTLEKDMHLADVEILDIKHTKNDLETYLYDNRAHLDTYGEWAKYMEEEPRTTYLAKLNTIEEWLYGEGAHTTKEEYLTRLNDLKKIGDPVKSRFKFYDLFPAKQAQMDKALTESYESAVSIPEDSHITKEEKDELIKFIEETTAWFKEAIKVQTSMKEVEDPVLDLNELENKKNEVLSKTTVVLNKPVPPPKKEEEKKDEPMPDAEKKEGEAPKDEAMPDAAPAEEPKKE